MDYNGGLVMAGAFTFFGSRDPSRRPFGHIHPPGELLSARYGGIWKKMRGSFAPNNFVWKFCTISAWSLYESLSPRHEVRDLKTVFPLLLVCKQFSSETYLTRERDNSCALEIKFCWVRAEFVWTSCRIFLQILITLFCYSCFISFVKVINLR